MCLHPYPVAPNRAEMQRNIRAQVHEQRSPKLHRYHGNRILATNPLHLNNSLPQLHQLILHSQIGLPLVRHPSSTAIPPPHPPTPRHPGPNLEHRLLQRTPLALPPHSLGEIPSSPHSHFRRLAAAFPPRAVAQSLRGPGQPLAAECDCRGGRSAVFDAVGEQ